MSGQFELERLRRGLRPFRLHWFPRLRSTNDHAAAMRRRGQLFAPSIVLTGHQLAGRGRGSNTWWSNRGSLTVTFALPVEEHLAPHQVPLVAGMAVRDACAQLTVEHGIQLKWPNDIVWRSDLKLAGLLCERINKVDLIGLGLNVNVKASHAPPSLRHRLTSLSDISGSPHDITDVLIAVAGHLGRMLHRRTAHPFQGLLREYDQHHALVGKSVSVMLAPELPQITGRCEGIDDTGRLLIRQRKALHRIMAGQVISRG